VVLYFNHAKGLSIYMDRINLAGSSWPDGAIDYLRVNWAPDPITKLVKSTRVLGLEITARFCKKGRVISKNAVVGMSHRLQLDPRPSLGLKRSATTDDKAKVKVAKSTRTSLRSQVLGVPPPVVARVVPFRPYLLALPAPRPMLLLAAPAPLLLLPAPVVEQAVDVIVPLRPTSTRRRRRSGSAVVKVMGKPSCLYPYGHPGKRDFHFCGKPTWSCEDPLRSQVYCREHHQICYIPRPRSDQQDAA
jgi:hypothetical protein